MKEIIRKIKNSSLFIRLIVFIGITFFTGLMLDYLFNIGVSDPYKKSKNFQAVWILTVIFAALYSGVLFNKSEEK